MAIIIYGACSLAWRIYKPRPLHPPSLLASPLTAKMRGKWADISHEFDRRVQANFAVGTLETQLDAELARQGFVRRDRNASPEAERHALRREDDWIVSKAARIYWRADAAGRLIAVRGVYLCEGSL